MARATTETELREIYDHIHMSNVPEVRTGRYIPDPLPTHGDSRWGLSLVALPPREIAARLASTAHALRQTASNPHVAYGREDVHITVRSLEGHDAELTDATVDSYHRGVTHLVSEMSTLRIRLRGLSTALVWLPAATRTKLFT